MIFDDLYVIYEIPYFVIIYVRQHFLEQLNVYLYQLFMIYMLKFICNDHVPLLELSVDDSVRYPRSATSTPIRYQPAICNLVP